MLCLLALAPLLLAAENYTPRDAADAQKWLMDTLKHAGVSDLKMEDNLVAGKVGSAHFVIPPGQVTSTQLQAPPAAPTFGVTAGVEWFAFPNVKDNPGHAFWHNSWVPAQAIRD